jgi:hypothetical protein
VYLHLIPAAVLVTNIPPWISKTANRNYHLCPVCQAPAPLVVSATIAIEVTVLPAYEDKFATRT